MCVCMCMCVFRVYSLKGQLIETRIPKLLNKVLHFKWIISNEMRHMISRAYMLLKSYHYPPRTETDVPCKTHRDSLFPFQQQGLLSCG